MKKNWLRGLLLGVSIALLVAGGVAMAQGLRVTVDQSCFECWPGNGTPTDEYMAQLTLSGYDPNEDLWGRLTMAGALFTEGPLSAPLSGPPCTVMYAVRCSDLMLGFDDTCEGNFEAIAFGGNVGPGVRPAEYGKWTVKMEQNGDSDEVSFLFARDCAAAMFVPEPGSILLLGSGLAGLAGYATLRLRSGQALRRRMRE
jgi:hypothetical protein